METGTGHDPADDERFGDTDLTLAEADETGRAIAEVVGIAIAKRFKKQMLAAGTNEDDADYLAMSYVRSAAKEVLTVLFTAPENQMEALDEWEQMEGALDDES